MPRRISLRLVFLLFIALTAREISFAQEYQAHHVLILFEGSDVPTNYARGDARQLAMLMGHFTVDYRLQGVDAYTPGEINNYDITFFIGFSKRYDPPEKFLRDIYTTSQRVVWMNTGMERFAKEFNLPKHFGFSFSRLDTLLQFDVVRAGKKSFTKGEPNLNIVTVTNTKLAEVVATAYSTKSRKESAYILRSGNFMYIADSPFASATETDRYIYFADMLHDLLGQDHEEVHRALLRIEDVDVFESPSKLRDIADMMYSKHLPFLVGVIPFFKDPGAGMFLSMSDKPEFVDALKYMVAHGATLVMHGITHQYTGVTATDFEFWDGSTNKKIRGDSKEYVEKKMKMGLEEFWKNNLYPLIWETPHYTASQVDYSAFAEFFSTAMEQRLVIEDPDYSQYFPYIIEKDLYGQRIIPENLGYIPLSDTPKVEEEAVNTLLEGAKAQLAVRDGFASAFIHAFIDLKYIEEYVDGVLDLGYTFMDLRNEPHIVRLKDRVVLTGNQPYDITLDDQYLRRTWFAPNGEVDHREISDNRIQGLFRDTVYVPPGEIFMAEPSEYREMELSWSEKLKDQATALWNSIFQTEEIFDEARVAIVWDSKAKGSDWNNQASFASAFRSLNIDVDSLSGDSIGSLSLYNLLVVPYHTVERLTNVDYDRIVQFVDGGGCLITDGKNDLAKEFGVKFASSSIKIERMRDRLYPEDPLILQSPDIMPRFEVDRDDESLCLDERTEAPVVVGRKYGNGRFLYFGIRFDPVSTGGFSRFPYIMEYIRQYFHLQPLVRRDNLEVYFDDGYRHNVSVEDLVKRWTTAGVRVVHVVGWHQYKTWTYDYERLIRLCHSNGILVYAWLDPPQVSERFWEDHPQWQEVNYEGKSIRPSWRYPVALTNPECLATVKESFRDFLLKYDWDGVNLAELYFESGNGPQDPRLLTPMHPSARADFRRKAGFDPVLLFDTSSLYYWKNNEPAWKRFEDYRVDVLTHLHEEFLKMMEEIRSQRPYFDVVVTALDNIGNPELRVNFGVDVQRIIELQKKYNFVLQIEDPQSEWSKDPRRYKKIGQRYQARLGTDEKLMLDLNILLFRDEKNPTMFPTLIQTGVESYLLVHSAALGADRFSIYSESSVRPQDLRMMSYAASARARVNHVPGGWVIDAAFPVVLELPKQYSAIRLSTGERITSDQGMFFLPAGHHELQAEYRTGETFPSTPPTTGRLLSISGKLTTLENTSRRVSFSYESETRCFASFSHRPFSVIVDGKELKTVPLEGYRRYSIVLPEGRHEVIAVLETTVSYGVDITSFWSSWFIVGVGMLFSAALISFYLIVRISRTSEARV